MIRKILLSVLVLALLGPVISLASTSPGRLVYVTFGWAALGYLIVRAWPGVRRDLGRLRAINPPRVRLGRLGRVRARGDVL